VSCNAVLHGGQGDERAAGAELLRGGAGGRRYLGKAARLRDAARAIGELGVGLEDAEYAGGVLWTGLTNKGAKGNPEEQKRVVVDRLTRWATRDGGDGSAVAAAVHAVLDEYLPGR
jgi:hypothetical protein